MKPDIHGYALDPGFHGVPTGPEHPGGEADDAGVA
jgi:hypothetical protein